MRLAKYLLALALTFAPMSALANTVTIPNTFQNGQFIDANLFNQNFQSIATFANGNIDNTNIGVAGFYASQIKPTTVAQAIFGGTVPYTFLTAPIMSGAGITAATIPNAALVTTPVTSVTGSSNIVSSGGTTPNITLASNPTIAGGNFTAGTVPNAALVTTPLTALTAGTNITLTGSAPNITISAASGAAGVTSVTASGNLLSSGGTTPNITISGSPSFTGNVGAANFSSNGAVNGNTFAFAGAQNPTLSSDGTYLDIRGVTSSGVAITNPANTANAAIIASVFTVGSDRRLKRDITPYTRGLDTIMALKPVRFVLRSDNRKSMGFIAQDVQKVLPELVTGNKLKGKVTLGVNYSGIIAPLVAAVQEQQREIVDLRAEIKALKQPRK